MEIFSDVMGFISVMMLIFVLIIALCFIIGTIDSNPKPEDFTQQEKRLNKEREYFKMMGLLLYWTTEAANELDIDPTEREEVLDAVDKIEDLVIEDRIYFDIDL